MAPPVLIVSEPFVPVCVAVTLQENFFSTVGLIGARGPGRGIAIALMARLRRARRRGG